MNLDSFNKWITLAANIGVLGGIIFLGIEIQQNTESNRLAEIQINRSTTVDLFRLRSESQFMPSIFLKAQNGEELSQEEAYRYYNYLSANWANIYYSWIQRDLNLADEYQPSDELQMPGILGWPNSLDWWHETGRIYPEDFQRYVETWISRLEIEE